MRHFGVRVTDRYRLDDLRTVILENELLRITFLADQGSDIIEFLYKPKDIDFLWRSPLASRRTRPFVPASPIHRPFLDHYAGGWQELFPHAGPGTTYLKADLGFHGEVWGLPWEHEIVKDQAEEVVVRFRVRTVRMPFYLEKSVSLRTQESTLRFHEVVVNEGKTPLQFMWGHHPAFGPPFLDGHCVLDAPACRVQIGEELLPWPVDFKGRDHSRLVPEESAGEVMKYLHDLREGWVALTNPNKLLGIGLVFDPRVFRYVWLWQEFEYTREYPWFGRAYVLGVEPHSSLPDAHQSGGSLLELAEGERLETEMLAVVYETSGVRSISPQGHVVPR